MNHVFTSLLSVLAVASSVRDQVADVGAQISDLGLVARRSLDRSVNEDTEGKVPNLFSNFYAVISTFFPQNIVI